jgi:hypothetical protein
MRSMCVINMRKTKSGKRICGALTRGGQKYCKHACSDEVHPFCAYGYPGGECREPEAIKETTDR